MRVCTNNFITGFRGRVLEYQGIVHDDVALTDIEAECNKGDEILSGLGEKRVNT